MAERNILINLLTNGFKTIFKVTKTFDYKSFTKFNLIITTLNTVLLVYPFFKPYMNIIPIY